MSKAITPKQALVAKLKDIPDEVFDAFNTLIVQKIDHNGRARIRQDDVVGLIVKNSNYKSAEIFDNNWLDVEGFYRKAGWEVKYDKPAYNESYPATFTFSYPE